MIRRAFLTALALASLALAGCVAETTAVPTEDTPPAAEDTTASTATPGGPARVKNGATVTVIQDGVEQGSLTVRVTTARREPGEFGMAPERGVFVVARITAVGGPDASPWHVNPFDFYVLGKDGTRFESTVATGFGPMLDAVDLRAGEKASGIVVFDASVSHGRVVYVPSFLQERAAAEWQF